MSASDDEIVYLQSEVQRLNTEIAEERRKASDAIQVAAIAETMIAALDGDPISDFMSSFGPVQRILNLQEMCKLLQGDVEAQRRVIMDACAHLRVTDDDEADWPKLAMSCASIVEERDRLRNALSFADQQGAEAIERVSTAIVNDKWNATSAFQARALNAEKERDALRLALAAERAGSGPWFVVHQRDGRPQLDVFSGDGAEHAAKMRARDHATNWSEVYIMRGVEVHGGDFEDEAMADRALSVKDPIRAESVQIDPETYAQVHRWAEPDIGGRSLNESTEALLSDLERVQAELEEARLTLAAEQGDSEGAPSDRWRCDGRNWYGDRGGGGMDKIEWYATLNGDGTVRHKRVWLDIDMHGFEKERGRFDLSRVAMQAADKALKAGSSS